MELQRETKFNLNLSSEQEVLAYTYTGDDPIEVMARVNLGDNSKPLSGVGGNYELNVDINGVRITPNSTVNVPSGATRTILVGRAIPIETDDVISIKAKGLGGDTQINTVASLRDVTPAQVSDLVGTGDVPVDHNYGGTDELTYETSLGAGIDDAKVLAYLKADYDAGDRGSEFVKARSTTNVDGQWEKIMMLDPGTYTLVFYKQGAYGPDTRDVVVA